MPLCYWWEAFTSVVFIINHLPTPVLGKKHSINYLILSFFESLDVRVSLVSALINLKSSNFVVPNVSFLGTTLLLKDISAKVLVVGFSFLIMLYSPSDNVILHLLPFSQSSSLFSQPMSKPSPLSVTESAASIDHSSYFQVSHRLLMLRLLPLT